MIEIDLHGYTLEEAMETAFQQIDWTLAKHSEGVAFIHGKGHGIAKIKLELRKLLNNDERIAKHGYVVINGESGYEIARKYDEGATLMVVQGRENFPAVNDAKKIDKENIIFSEDGKEFRKQMKKVNHAGKTKRIRQSNKRFEKEIISQNSNIPETSLTHNPDKGTESLCSTTSFPKSIKETRKRKKDIVYNPEKFIHSLQKASDLLRHPISELAACLKNHNIEVSDSPQCLITTSAWEILKKEYDYVPTIIFRDYVRARNINPNYLLKMLNDNGVSFTDVNAPLTKEAMNVIRKNIIKPGL